MSRSSAPSSLYARIREILDSARAGVARTVNTAQVVAYWLIGREIVEEEQKGRLRAHYGQRLLAELSAKLTRDFGGGYSSQNLAYMKQFYVTYPSLLSPDIIHALRGKSRRPAKAGAPIKTTLLLNIFWGLTNLRKFSPAVINFTCPLKLNLPPS